MTDGLYSIDLRYACGGIIVADGKVVHTAPLWRWMVGKRLAEVIVWVKQKHGTIAQVEERQP
jgi:hypothetical protein